jgi:hypothetical protein
MYRSISMLLLFIMFAACFGVAQNLNASLSKDSSAPEKLIADKLHAMYEAEKRHDLQFILSSMAEDFEEIGGDGGVYNRSDLEAAWNDVKLNDYKLSDCSFKLVTKDVAYQSCLMDVDATYKGKRFPGRIRVTWVWTELNGNWLLKFEQGTIVPEAKTDTGS